MAKLSRPVRFGALALPACLLAACAPASRPAVVVRGAAEGVRGARVEDARFVRLGGLEQWITIRGESDRQPVLLAVHGGPGDVQSPLVSSYAPYEQDFVLVPWDQRGAGHFALVTHAPAFVAALKGMLRPG